MTQQWTIQEMEQQYERLLTQTQGLETASCHQSLLDNLSNAIRYKRQDDPFYLHYLSSYLYETRFNHLCIGK